MVRRPAFVLGVLASKRVRVCASSEKERVCSILTADEQTFLIGNRLYRVCEKDTLKSGTFMMVRTKCDHGQSLHLAIMPDEGKCRGCVLSEYDEMCWHGISGRAYSIVAPGCVILSSA